MSRPPAPDPAALQEADALLDDALQALDHRLQEYVAAWAAELEVRVTGPLRSCLEEVVCAHERLADSAGLGPLSAAPDPESEPEGEEAGPEAPEGSEDGETEDRGGPEAESGETGDREGSTADNGKTADREGAPGAGKVPESEGSSPAAPAAVPACAEWSCLRDYRNGVALHVVTPLLETLVEHRPGEHITEEWQQFVLGLRGCADPLPEEVVRTEPPELYAPTPGDGPLRRLRKLTVRAGRRLGEVFRRAGPRAQTVALRDLARTSLRGEALPGVVDLASELHRYHGTSLASVEMGLGRWLREWLPVEDSLHTAWEHLSREARRDLERLRSLGAPPESGEGGAERDPDPDAAAGDEVPGASDVASGSEAESRDEESVEPAAVARHLHRQLVDAARRLNPPEELVQRVRAGVAGLREHLAWRVRHAGTPLDRPPSRSEDRRHQRLRERLVEEGGQWNRWHDVAGNRVGLVRDALELRRDLDEELQALLDGALDASVRHLDRWLGQARDGILALRDEAGDPSSPLLASSDREAVAEATSDYLERAREILARSIDEPLQPDRTEGPLREALDGAVERIDRRLRLLDEATEVHPIRETVPRPDPDQATRTVPLRDAVRQALGALELEELRTSVTPLVAYLEDARSECQGIPNVVSYNLEAARDELLQESQGARQDGEEDAPDPEVLMADARSLTLQGLERTAATLDGVVAGGVQPFVRFTEGAHGTLHRALVRAQDRITMEGAVQEQIRDVRTLVLTWIHRTRARLRERGEVFRAWAEREGRRRYVQLQRLIRKGRSAVGADVGGEGEAERAMEVLGSISRLLEPLPLVYRRLFSFQPVTDPALLVGRDDETAWVVRRWTAWQDGLRAPSLLTGPVTVGHTSFLNVLTSTVFKDVRVVRLVFTDRCATPEAVAARVAEALGDSGLLDGAEGPWTLDRLASLLLEADADGEAPPTVILVENLAHLFLRTPGGGRPLERLLDFQARTSPAVFWLSTTSEPSWKLVQKTEPRAAALVTRGEVSAMTRAELESMIAVRHQRSGVPLEFLAPPSPNALLRRKLQRVRNEEERQALLREEFFDRLHRGSQGNPMMAILLWLRSADFASRQGWLRLRPPRPLRFAFLDELDLDVDFALMALLEHASLTLGEFTRIFAVEEDQAYQTLEVLRSRMLLDRLSTMGSLPEPVRSIRDGVRYRIPPILAQVVSQYLRNHNILH